ncbi:hypothetical protein Btru_053609 [Bulinus truncatus]|nr:hypothetical protein Btru_053609 [Bulinus truncatus]
MSAAALMEERERGGWGAGVGGGRDREMVGRRGDSGTWLKHQVPELTLSAIRILVVPDLYLDADNRWHDRGSVVQLVTVVKFFISRAKQSAVWTSSSLGAKQSAVWTSSSLGAKQSIVWTSSFLGQHKSTSTNKTPPWSIVMTLLSTMAVTACLLFCLSLHVTEGFESGQIRVKHFVNDFVELEKAYQDAKLARDRQKFAQILNELGKK